MEKIESKQRIVVYIIDGAITVDQIPNNVEVEIRDYDSCEYNSHTITEMDESGMHYISTLWE
jgi:hypothetical protein